MDFDDSLHDEQAEQIVLGSVLLAPAVFLELGSLASDAFYFPEHQSVFEAFSSLHDSRLPIDAQSVWKRIQERKANRGRLSSATYLHDCMSLVASPASAGFHARTVREMSARRATRQFATRVAARSGDPSVDVAVILDEIESHSRNLVDSVHSETSIASMRELLEDAVSYVEGLASGEGQKGVLRTGFTDLDRLTNGLRPGQLVCVAARPGAGKTSLALDILRHNALRDGRSVLMFSLEMSARELMLRLISAETHIPLIDLLSGKVNDAQWAAIAKSFAELSEANITIVDDASITSADTLRIARRVIREKGDLDLVLIDYLQLMRSGGRTDSRQQEVADISRNAKIMAKELEVPVVALSQLNRAVESRPDKKPALSDLRESGAIEQDSDVVLLIHREEMYVPETPRVGEADIIVAKNRSGPQGNVVLTWMGSRSTFANAAHVYQRD